MAFAVSVALTVPPVVARVTVIALPATEIARALVAPELTKVTLTALPESFSSRLATNLMESLPPPPLIVAVSPPAVRVSVLATAAVLMVLVLVLFITARLLGGRAAGHMSARQRRRATERSLADMERIETALGRTPE